MAGGDRDDNKVGQDARLMIATKERSSRPLRIGQTAVSYQPAKSILIKTSGFLADYDFTLNPYSGCGFGCAYCYAAFFATSDELRENWGHWVGVKHNAAELLRDYLMRRRKGPLNGERIYMSSVTDPYQPIERRLGLTRRLLEILAAPVERKSGVRFDMRHAPKLVVQTRSPLVARDIDLFRRIEDNGGRVQVNMTVTTDDEDIRRVFEPFCPSNPARLRAIGEVEAAGVQTCVTMTPLLLVSEPNAFADSLLQTGVGNFIIQAFHFARGKFVASTREQAVGLMCEKLGCEREAFQDAYMERYNAAHEIMKARLPRLGEGKDGFKPPF